MALRAKATFHIHRMVVTIMLPLVLLCFFLFHVYERSIGFQAFQRLQSEQEKALLIISNQINTAFSQFVSDLMIVYNSNELTQYSHEPNAANQGELGRLFIRIAMQKVYIEHLRFINEVGYELLQVDRSGNAGVLLIEDDELEDLGQSELYVATRTLAPWVLYLSTFLKPEHAKPQVTLALPVYRGSVYLGTLAIDFDASYLLSFLPAYQSTLSKDLGLLLVDSQGKVILTGDDEPTSVMGSGRNLFLEVPELRVLCAQQGQGTGRIGDDVFTFTVLYPRSSENLVYTVDRSRIMTLVSHFHMDQLADLSQDFILTHPYLKYLISITIFLVGCLLVIFQQLRAGDKQQMRITSFVAQYASNSIVVCDARGLITFCNKSFEEMSGYDQNELIGTDSRKLRQNIPTPDIDENEMPVWVIHKTGNRLLVKFSTTKLLSRRERTEYTVEVYSPSHWNLAEFLHSSDLAKSLVPALDRLKGTRTISALCIQIANAKELGLRMSLRERMAFSVILSLHLAQYVETTLPIFCTSFDCYLVFLHACPMDDTLIERVASLLHSFNSPFRGREIDLSIGISNYPTTSISLQALPADAYFASQLVEQSKSIRYLCYTTDVRKRTERQRAVKSALSQMSEPGQLCLHYQAQLSVKTGAIIGAEALIRWVHPKLGNINPDEFLLLLDEQQLAQLGRIVITQSIAFLRRNQNIIETYTQGFSLSINLSAQELATASLINLIGAQLREHRIPDGQLTVELTEHTAVESLPFAGSVLDKLKAQGVSIAIDDFGTGYSSLSYLLELPVDKIKIDRSFISRYPDSDSITIYKTVLLLAKEVGATVVAEGVEEANQLAFLNEIGCDHYQGYYFSKAVDEQTFLTQLERKYRELIEKKG